ncbi:Serine/threonine-protein phosphatase 2A regulatory subunit B'' subunit alpha [Acipenser ruthenus]|uniref:Serine/threonine-protein phosphatase 2A regulatory subunit B'' subunit alpha n=1 Tax=Acipenser ruthenus TaxID=7906 RepID=A0A444U3W5_ACIRT|nr:Serine/threonine-protein phosphatase 2A regulatory subunit B'' subunit alpha [Acipenser ruthenus]
MAAAYRIVVSTTNCYNSVVIDRRFQHTVHYCNGPCQVHKHGVVCTVAHRSTCSELLNTTAEPATGGRPFSTQDLSNTFSAVENGTAVPGDTSEDYHQIMQGAPRVKKGLTIQSSTSLKDITGDAINLASGKIKEFSFEKIKYSTSHVTFRKGRKVRPESFSRRSTDLDIIYGHFSSDENCPPFGFVQKSMMEEHKLSRSSSLEQNINNIPVLYLNSLTEENLIAKILEKAKADSSASGEEIKACLDILLKCSEDLKKCTDIIKQCIKNKSMSGDSDGSFTNPEVIYRSVMARLSSYLKKLPFDFEHVQHGRSEHSDLAELVNSFHGLQQTPFSPIFGNEQPPRYEDVVHSPPLTKTLPPLSTLELQEIPQDSANNGKSVQSFANLQCNTISPNSVRMNSTAVNSSSALPQALKINRSDSYSSTNSLLSSSSDSICKESMVALYIEEEHDVGKVLDKELRGEGKFSQGFMEVRQLPKKPIALMETGDSTAKLSGNIKNGTTFKPNLEPFALPGASKPYVSLKNLYTEPRAFQEPSQSNDQDDIDKLLMDLECLSQKIELEPCLNGKSAELKNCSQQAGPHQHLSFDSGSSQPPVDSLTPSSSKKDTNRHGYTTNEEEDGALLLRILESIENFAQELVESGTGKGRLSREGEVMRLLQETVANTGKSEQNLQTSCKPTAIRDTGPTLSIQQTPEVIKEWGTGKKEDGVASVVDCTSCRCQTCSRLLHSCYDDASKFVYLLVRPGCAYLEQEDFIPLLQDIVDTHPGLTFLKDAPEFHSRYITTVIQRIFYTVNRSWSGKITMTELRRSNFLQTLALLEEEDDINQITDYFSYEHFYVIYCKFWELDTDHDLFVDQKDLARYNEHASSNRITERIFSGAVTRGNSVQKEGRMSYADFVWFLISEEDKKNPTSIEYWFKCMDLDGDGVLSMYELEYFYEEQCERMEGMGIEPLPFHDLLCQMLDLVKCTDQGKITLRDLKHCRMAHIFYDTFFNLEKYLDHEQRDPFAVQKDVENDGPEPSDWDKYAAEEYEILVAEETANEQLQEGTFEDDESDELTVASEIGNKVDKLVISDLSA